MTVQAWLVFTPSQKAAAFAKSETTNFKVIPRDIDNPLAGNLGDPAVVVGNAVAPASILNDAEYSPVWLDSLGNLPIRTLDSDILFLPPEA